MKEKFSSKTAFIMASAGSAVGLGNLFRFPSLCGRYGGIFVAVYILLLALLGLPILYCELTLGRRFGSSPPKAFGSLYPFGKWVGALCCFNSFAVMCCYGLLFSFVLSAAVCSFPLYFPDSAASAPLIPDLCAPGRFTLPALFFFLLSWGITLLSFGSAEKLGKISTVGMILSTSLLVGLAIFAALTRPDGLLRLFYLEPRHLLSLGFWGDTAGQVFFSLSLSVGVMVTYGSYMAENQSIGQSAVIIGLFDLAVSLAAAVIYLSFSAEGGEGDILSCFGIYPTAFASLGPAGGPVSTLFFFSLAFLCLDSVFAYLKSVTEGLSARISASQRLAPLAVALPAFIFGLVLLSTGLVPFFDDRITPLFSLIAGLLEALIFSRGICDRSFLPRGGKAPTARLLLLSVGVAAPAFLAFLIFCEIFH